MDLAWNPYALPGLLVFFVGNAMAVLVLLTGHGRRANRLLGLALVLEATSVGFGFGFGYLASDPQTAMLAQRINITLFLGLIPAYLAFIGTLVTPLTTPLRTRWGMSVVLAIYGGLALFWFARPAFFIPSMTHTPYAAWDLVQGPGFVIIEALAAAALVYSFAAAISAWRHAPEGSVMRRRAKAYAIAYGTRDALLVAMVIGLAILAIRGEALIPAWLALGVPVANLVGELLLAYAILRTQLFDIDLRIKLTIQRGTVVAAFVITFFIVEKIAEAYLARAYGIIAGSIATGLLLFLAPRLNKMAEQVGNKAVPAVQNTSQYLAYKKLDVYRGAIEESLHHGPLTEKDRAVLERLRTSLDIPADDALALEADVQRTLQKQAGATPALA